MTSDDVRTIDCTDNRSRTLSIAFIENGIRIAIARGGGAWREEFERGDFPTVKAMAEAHGLDPSNVRHAFNLAFLSPRILEVIVAGWDMPPDLSVARLLRVQSLVWDEQEREFGFSG